MSSEGLDAVVANAGPTAPAIYVIDAPEHPFDLAPFADGLGCTLVNVPVKAWGDALTPWPAPSLFRGEPDYGGHAKETLDELLRERIPAIEASQGLSPSKRAICGYSLGGLFALYAFVNTDTFAACACLSGSVWYEGWLDYLRGLDLDLAGRFAYLSLGTKEKRGARPLMRSVQDNMEACASLLKERGCEVRFELGPGNHFQFVRERYEVGLGALGDFLNA